MTHHRGTTRLIFVVHNHQPVGNFDFVFEKATDASYAAFVDLLAEHPKVRVGLHFTGPLLEWLESNRPGILSTVREMCQIGQVEILGGGWAEPMLSILPDRDALGQMQLMRSECARLFGSAPRGMWLAERVWDPGLPSLLKAAKMEYTLLDDTHFRYAGLLDERLVGHYVTEKAGDAIAVFPIDRELRYAIPFRKPEEAIKSIRDIGSGTTVTYGDDGEKFGIWPHTHEWVWGKGWLKQFFELLENPEQGIELIHPSEQLDNYRPSGRVYLPTASYHEMGEWTLNARAGQNLLDLKKRLTDLGLDGKAEPFLHGGIWMGFLSKYPESNILHKKMIHASAKVESAEGETDKARKALYRGQCNCPYWHGLFGGLYLPHLRHAVYQQIVEAEAIIDENLKGVRLEIADLDGDLCDEIALETNAISVWIAPETGGQVLALDDRKRKVSLGHVLSRRPETYHRELLAIEESMTEEPPHIEEGGIPSIHETPKGHVPDLEKRLIYDVHNRRIAVDRLLPSGTDLTVLERSDSTKDLANLVGLHYEIHHTETNENRGSALLRGTVPLKGKRGGILQICKQYSLRAPAELTVEWELILLEENRQETAFEALFAVETALALVPGNDNFTISIASLTEGESLPSQHSPQDRGRMSAVKGLLAGSSLGNATVEMTPSIPADVAWFPIDTVSQSENGAELVYQGTVITTVWPITFEPGKPVMRAMTLRLG